MIALCSDVSTLGPALDLGTGHGRSAQAVAESCKRFVVGIDLGGEKLAEARKRLAGLPVDFVCADATRLPFKDESFALVTATLTVHEFERSSVRSALLEVKRVLMPEGRLVVIDKCRISGLSPQEELTLLTEEAYHKALKYAAGVEALGVLKPEEFVKLVESAGFKVEGCCVGRLGKWLPPEEFLSSWGFQTRLLIQQIEDREVADRLRSLVNRIVEIASEHGYGPAPVLFARFSKT